VECCIKVNIKQTTISKALIKAVLRDNLSNVLRLLKKGANPNAVEDECLVTPLHFAAQNGSLEIIKALFTAGACVTAVTIEGDTPLDVAIFCKQSGAEELLKKSCYLI
jgi:ankyrin repeat protein